MLVARDFLGNLTPSGTPFGPPANVAKGWSPAYGARLLKRTIQPPRAGEDDEEEGV
jgi:hypothetical protein